MSNRSPYMTEARRESFYTGTLPLLCWNHEVIEFTPYQFRIDGVLDVYPTNRRWHLLRSNERGSYGETNALEEIERLVAKGLAQPKRRRRHARRRVHSIRSYDYSPIDPLDAALQKIWRLAGWRDRAW